ncbi:MULTISPECIES: YggS family pyridoxal phosphate-dependent enzyme [unclassified Herbaspirillum]|uniref:YggS family pyridoxal phosphate-dependent enzyme n=1 Tax=unclassified Herbaspirillum TaxID=2624150 RepID=UPI000E2FD2E3|nr:MULTISPECIES: YggS family pyridoxal phosphate-dependent enzyme [unclassified Herbaspirillum]RFB69457.1 YggS family pyridoxal phosphate-dependent enzyme [Herbaspirillum sp. 3R-3a1]TFI07487.1 YggS family pyridoxal phosphate-dependent enzyme [Herbaspirillum sp. 3R11]TFI12261.1 YggS family pyridoxal phosphate-dependent enzyme [Herbaspirillum sp. 3R-11]TFI22694.1 YggS family pyridoxal phosphate-dependent enzyme [Herbaspirillum sp. 3C11]
MSSIAKQLQVVNARIAAAAQAAGRNPQDVLLLAVSKFFDAGSVLEAVRAGQTAFGENYVQEALDKIAALKLAAPEVRVAWHFIGPIQSNKTRQIAENFDWVHSVDREKIARRLAEQRPPGLPPLNICLQVNISDEDSKSGLSPDELLPVARAVAAMPGLCLRGLMAIPAPTEVEAEQRAAFRRLRELAARLIEDGIACDTLSMGMSADMDAAIAEGATIVRVGTAIFGQRQTH